MSDPIVITRDLPGESDTAALGRELAGMVRPGDAILLRGDLGAGKTTLARAFIRALCGEATEVPSPTFNIVLTYQANDLPIWHFDLYRLESERELMELGYEDTDDGVILVEWPERMGDATPQWRLDITLRAAPAGRLAVLAAHGPDWSERLERLAR